MKGTWWQAHERKPISRSGALPKRSSQGLSHCLWASEKHAEAKIFCLHFACYMLCFAFISCMNATSLGIILVGKIKIVR